MPCKIFKFWDENGQFPRYFPGFLYFPNHPFESYLDSSKSDLGSFFTFLTKLAHKHVSQGPDPKLSATRPWMTLTSNMLTETEWYLELYQTRSVLVFWLISCDTSVVGDENDGRGYNYACRIRSCAPIHKCGRRERELVKYTERLGSIVLRLVVLRYGSNPNNQHITPLTSHSIKTEL